MTDQIWVTYLYQEKKKKIFKSLIPALNRIDFFFLTVIISNIYTAAAVSYLRRSACIVPKNYVYKRQLVNQ